jgi:hypothetical protein
MAIIKYTNPPQTPSGEGTFADNLVGFQLVQGGGLTQGNFEFVEGATEKVDRKFIIGVFSSPITLDTLQIDNLLEARSIIAKNFQVYPNFDLSIVTNFTIYGSLSKRLETSVQRIISFFPAAIELSPISSSFASVNTATSILYDPITNSTSLQIDMSVSINPFNIDTSINAGRNISSLEIPVSYLRNFTDEFKKYALFINGGEYDVLSITATTLVNSGILTIVVQGNPFSGSAVSSDYLILRPQTYYTEQTFKQSFDEVESFLLNRLVDPIYTASFQVPEESNSGQYYIAFKQVTWPLLGQWNLDILSVAFDGYLSQLSDIGTRIDEYKTNLITRFLTTDSLKEFDTYDQKIVKVFQIYGRSFDEIKHFIDALAFMNSVNYTIQNDIPSQLLKNLAETLGWKTNISPITDTDFLNSVFGYSVETEFPGYSRAMTPDELNYQYYRNLILNSAYLFKSKGTRKSIEGLMRLIGAPEALIEFNEHIYLAGQRINMSQFNNRYAQITGGTYVNRTPILDPSDVYSILGTAYTGTTVFSVLQNVTTVREDYPVDESGLPRMPEESETFFFQLGAGWYQRTPDHRSPEIINYTTSVFTGSNFNIQTELEPFTYGQKYLDRYRKFPFIGNGFRIYRIQDNKKSWIEDEPFLRRYSEAGFNARYQTPDDKLVLNVKNIDLCLNPAQGLVYDVWVMSNNYDYPIPDSGFTNSSFPYPYGVDWTIINPEPKKLTFFEFAQTFWLNMINVRDRLYSFDGKTSGYPLLQRIYWMYLLSNQTIGIPNDNFTYRNMIDYVVGIGDYWMRLVEQMIPATTIWLGGIKYENSAFHRQKFVWRRQAGCQIVPIPCEPCILIGNLYNIDCLQDAVTCNLYPLDPRGDGTQRMTFNRMLQIMLTRDGVTFPPCYVDSLITEWFLIMKIDGVEFANEQFFNGIGLSYPNSVPQDSDWLQAINDATLDLFSRGLGYIISGDTITLYSLDCELRNLGKVFSIDVMINYDVRCLESGNGLEDDPNPGDIG